jgi:hypothetical protein
MKWKRVGRGVYDSEDGRFSLTFIQHWELVEHADPEDGRPEDKVTNWPSKHDAQEVAEEEYGPSGPDPWNEHGG